MKLKKLLTNSRKCDKIKKHLRLRLLERKSRKIKKFLTNREKCDIIIKPSQMRRLKWEHSSAGRAHALQAWGHRFEPCCSHHLYGHVVQLVRTLACHARGRRFEPVHGRHLTPLVSACASVAQLVEQGTENPCVVGSIPTGGTNANKLICGFSSSGRAPPCQGGGSEFEPRNPLHFFDRRIISPVNFNNKAYGAIAKW